MPGNKAKPFIVQEQAIDTETPHVWHDVEVEEPIKGTGRGVRWMREHADSSLRRRIMQVCVVGEFKEVTVPRTELVLS